MHTPPHWFQAMGWPGTMLLWISTRNFPAPREVTCSQGGSHESKLSRSDALLHHLARGFSFDITMEQTATGTTLHHVRLIATKKHLAHSSSNGCRARWVYQMGLLNEATVHVQKRAVTAILSGVMLLGAEHAHGLEIGKVMS